MASLGIKFDCASKQELEDVLKVAPASSIIYANPCKSIDHIQYSQQKERLYLLYQ